MGISELCDRILKPFLIFQYLAPIALYPPAIIIFGLSEASKIFVLAYTIFFPVMISTREGIQYISKDTLNVYRLAGASKLIILKDIIFPAILPYTFIGMYFALIPAFVVLISAEMLGGSTGIGYLVLLYQRTFQVGKMYACIVVILLIATMIATFFKLIQRYVIHWAGK